MTLSDVATQYPEVLRRGDTGQEIRVLQYYLAYIAEFVGTVNSAAIDGSFGESTENAVRSFQQTYGLPVTGIVDEVTWNRMYNVYLGLIGSLPITYTEGVTLPFPGRILQIGSEGEAVRVLQEYLNYIALSYPNELRTVTVNGIFGANTEQAVIDLQELFGLSGPRGSVNAALWKSITDVYDDLFRGNIANEGQNPGYTVS